MRFVAMLSAVALVACGSEAEPETFILMQRDLQDFRSWPRYDLGAGEAGDTHPAGARTVYVNRVPDASDESFPVGTILVKTVEEAGGTLELHAMSKRGGDFNTGGALGWEWLELELTADGAPVVMWRGRAPPSGEGYGGDGVERADCNVCHAEALANDYVMSPKLRLGAF